MNELCLVLGVGREIVEQIYNLPYEEVLLNQEEINEQIKAEKLASKR